MPTPEPSPPPDNLPEQLRAWRVVIVLHFYATGPGQELHDWLQSHGAAESYLLEHPFPFSKRDFARAERARSGAPPAERRLPRRSLPMMVRYALDLLRTALLTRGA